MAEQKKPVAVFDSGMGGISVLRQIHRLMPDEDYLFYGDSKRAPYGVRSTQEVRHLTIEAARYFVEKRNAKAIVVACNTATSAAIESLREIYRGQNLPIIGLEPALKPAVTEHPHGTILVMATPLTLREEKFSRMLRQYEQQAHIIELPAPGLVELVEQGELGTARMRGYLNDLLQPYQQLSFDAVVLGCTHFPFAREDIQYVLGENVMFYDGALGAARQLKRQLEKLDLLAPENSRGSICFENSAPGEERLQLSRRLFERR